MYKSISPLEYKTFLGVDEDYIVDSLLIYGGWNRQKYITMFLNRLDHLGISYTLEKMNEGFLGNITSVIVNRKRIRFDVAYGGAYLSELTHIACIFGCQKSILLGSCGGLKPGITSESIIIPSFSYTNESSARVYNPYNTDHTYKPDETLCQKTVEQFTKEGKEVLREAIITCQGMLGETWEHIQERSGAGYGGVEMESGVLFAVCSHFQVSASAILRVADNLIEQETVMSEGYEKRGEERINITETMFDVAVKTIIEQ